MKIAGNLATRNCRPISSLLGLSTKNHVLAIFLLLQLGAGVNDIAPQYSMRALKSTLDFIAACARIHWFTG
jgi:hypothetical protein